MYLLDTNHCSWILQGQPTVLAKLSVLDGESVATCVIVRGELIYMAERSEQKEANLKSVHEFLSELVVYPIDAQTADIYGKLKSTIMERLGPREKAKRRQMEPIQLGFKDNDLWIAAIAKQHGLTIVTSDSDFERLKEIGKLKIENWMA